MNQRPFEKQIEAAQERLQELLQRLDRSDTDERTLVKEATEALSNSLEELHVTHEELQQQNAELVATREQLATERQRYQDLFAFAPDGYVVTDAAGLIQEANRAAVDLFGVDQDLLTGKAMAVFVPVEEQEAFYGLINRLRSGEPQPHEPWETELQPRSGMPFPAAVTVAPIRDDSGAVTGLRWLIRDVTKRWIAEDKLRESEKRFRLLFDNARDGIFVHPILPENQPGSFFQVNEAACEMLGYSPEEFSQMSPWELDDPEHGSEYIPQAMAQLQEEGQAVFEAIQVAKDGHKVFVEVNANVWALEGMDYIVSVVRDITARKRAEAQLQQYADELEQRVAEKVRQLEQERAKAIQMDKMASLGEMATGVAHELNQPLTAMMLEADYLKQLGAKAKDKSDNALPALDPAMLIEIAENFEHDLARCNRLVKHLRDFGRTSEEPPESICLNRPIRDSFLLVGARLHNHGVEVRRDLAEDLPPILAHPHKLEQVFLNLINNAEDAMDEKAMMKEEAGQGNEYRKVLAITTVAEEGEVIATVCDNGCGIPPEVQERIFDPFFTTKPRGEGTGLGLSISCGIVADCDGEITCQSTEGEGTTFTLRFPAAGVMV